MNKQETMNNKNIESILTEQVFELKKYTALYEMKSSELLSSFYDKFQSLFFKIDDVAYSLANIYEEAKEMKE